MALYDYLFNSRWICNSLYGIQLLIGKKTIMSDNKKFDELAYEQRGKEIERLREENDKLRGIKPELGPFPPEGEGLPRYGIRWNGPQEPLAVPMSDGYWTPWHLANNYKEEREQLNKDCAHLRLKLAAATCDPLEKALAKIDELQDKLDEFGDSDHDWSVDEHGYEVSWHEGWGIDSISCGKDLEKAKTIAAGKIAEGKECVMVEQRITRYLEDDEDEDA
jgi:hypothetical protein